MLGDQPDILTWDLLLEGGRMQCENQPDIVGVTVHLGTKATGLVELRADPRFLAGVAAGEVADHGTMIEISRAHLGMLGPSEKPAQPRHSRLEPGPVKLRRRFRTVTSLTPDAIEAPRASDAITWEAMLEAGRQWIENQGEQAKLVAGCRLHLGPKVPGLDALRRDPRFVAAVTAGDITDRGPAIEISKALLRRAERAAGQGARSAPPTPA